MNQAPHWLEVVVIEGLQMLLTLRLRNAPASDTITAVLDVWLVAIMNRNPVWIEERDAHVSAPLFCGSRELWMHGQHRRNCTVNCQNFRSNAHWTHLNLRSHAARRFIEKLPH